MPIPGLRLKLVPFGTINGVQDWSTTINCRANISTDFIGLSNLQAWTDDLEAYFETWATAVHGDWLSSCHYVGLKSYWYAVAGDHATFAAEHLASSPIAGVGTIGLPAFTSLVCSFHTGLVGKSYRGRSYMPLTANGVDGSGNIGSGDVGAVATAYQALINSINAYTNVGQDLTSLRCVVASAVKSALTPITTISVDSMPDTQHRRTDQLSASSTSTKTIT